MVLGFFCKGPDGGCGGVYYTCPTFVSLFIMTEGAVFCFVVKDPTVAVKVVIIHAQWWQRWFLVAKQL
jgi:hypothetical protein